jgi:hypothetical protein
MLMGIRAKTLAPIGESQPETLEDQMRIRAPRLGKTVKLKRRRSLYVITLYTPRIVGPESQHLHHLCRA